MLLKLRKTGEQFDCSYGIAQALLAIPNSPVEIPPKAPRQALQQRLTWEVRQGINSGEIYLVVRCESCRTSSTVSNFSGDPDSKKAIHSCCRRSVYPKDVPEEIQREYFERKKEVPKKAPTSLVSWLKNRLLEKELTAEVLYTPSAPTTF